MSKVSRKAARKGLSIFPTVPVKVMSKLFRVKYLVILNTLWDENKLQFHGSSEAKKTFTDLEPDVHIS